MKKVKKRIVWIVGGICALVILLGVGGTAISNVKGFFDKNKDNEEPVKEEQVDDTTTQASVDYDYELIA